MRRLRSQARGLGRTWPGAYGHNPADHRGAYGASTYNTHADGSGVAYASHRRPLLTLKSGFVSITEPGGGSGVRHFQADSHLWAWLEAQGIRYDVVTDHELHHEGADVLKGYEAVATCTHPEYHTKESLDALQHYRDSGGRLLYLGGNGFYWRIAMEPPGNPAGRFGALEIRRAEGGIRAWAARAGEYYHSFDGQLGGLWRRHQRPPQALCGVGFSAQGLFEGSRYRIKPSARSALRTAWIFEVSSLFRFPGTDVFMRWHK
eukprot:5543419-Pyramimonas_sp.AAC.1